MTQNYTPEEQKILSTIVRAWNEYEVTAGNGWYGNVELTKLICFLESLVDIKVVEEKWEPEMRESVWLITDRAEITCFAWGNHDSDRKYRDFLGVYPTKEAAEAQLQKIKEVLKTI